MRLHLTLTIFPAIPHLIIIINIYQFLETNNSSYKVNLEEKKITKNIFENFEINLRKIVRLIINSLIQFEMGDCP